MKFAILAAVFSVVIASGAPISGTIVDDATGAPVPKSEVRIFGLRPPPLTIEAGDDGTFQTGDLASGAYTVTVWHPGYLYTEIAASGHPLVIRLVRLVAMEGQLTGLAGRTAKVLALVKSGEIWKPVLDRFTRGVSAGADGKFRIPDLPPGQYALLVAYGNSGALRFSEGVTMPIPPNGNRVIEATIEMPEPRDWYWVTLTDLLRPELAVATTVTDEKGAFSFHGVVPGAYDVLAVPGEGERGAQSNQPPYHGFARASVDVTLADARGIKVTPQQAIKVSVALQHASGAASPGCLFGMVTLMPREDWGVWLERTQSPVVMSYRGESLSPESIDGLAPAIYGVSVDSGGCGLVAANPAFDLTHALTGDSKATIRESGIVRGSAEAGAEVILIPDDFAEGWSFLPATWFDEKPFGGQLSFRFQAFSGNDDFGPFLPHVRMAVTDADGHFGFIHVPPGGYRIGLSTKDMKRLDLPPMGDVSIALAAPK